MGRLSRPLRDKTLCPIFESQRQITFESTEALVNDRKFDTAIRLSQLTNFLHRIDNGRQTQDDQLILDYMAHHDHVREDLVIDHSVYSRWLLYVLTTTENPRRWNKVDCSTIDKIWELVKDNLVIQNGYMTHLSELPDHEVLRSTLESAIMSAAPDLVLKRLVIASTKLAVLVEKTGLIQGIKRVGKSDEEYRSECGKINTWRDESLQLRIAWSNRLCIIQLAANKLYILPKACLLLFHNKVCDLISTLICTKVAQLSSMSDNAYDAVLSLVKEMCRLNIRYQSKFYTIIKSLESLVTAETLRKVDAWDNREFYDALVDELYQSCNFDYESSMLKQILNSVDVPTMHELGCLSKMVGHPLVQIEDGAKSLHKKVTEEYTLDRITLAKCECHIKINYIRNSILRDGKWPPCYLSRANMHPAIVNGWAKNMDPYCLTIKEKYGTPSVLDFQFVELLPNLKFSELENTIPYLKDKTISLLRSKVIAKHFRSLAEKYDDPETHRERWADTRLLLYYLTNTKKTLDHTGYLHKYSQSADLSDLLDYLAIRCVPKEKELKIDPRFFGCKTYEERFRSLAQEKNAMKFLELYSDEQAMTLSELELARRLVAFRRLSLAYRDHYIMYIVVDASSWNNHFRQETVDDIMVNTLDKIFDVNIFGKTHLAFKNTLVYVPDEEVTYGWDGQDGGIEGLNQDTWVITYLGQIKTALEPLNLRYHALCKGDDLRIAICIPQHTMAATDLPKFKNDVMKRVSDTAQELGHKIKIEESFGSLRYFAFSKEASIGNIMLPQTLRKIQKVHGYNNAFLPYIDDMIASTYSNAHSACKVSSNVLPSEITGLFWCFYYMTQHPVYADLSHDEYLALSLVPSLAGGFPIIYHHNMYVRAESDLLSPFIGLIQYLINVNPVIAEYMMRFCLLPSKEPETLERVYKDPYAIGTLMPMLPSSLLRNFIEPMLTRITKNEDVLNLIKAAKSVSSREFVRCLDSSNVLPARIFAALYAACPKGILSELLAKFETSRSVMQLLILGSGANNARRILRRLLKQDLKLQTWRKNMLKGKISGKSYAYLISNEACPAAIANQVREMSWGKPVETVTMPPLQHQVYFTTPEEGSKSLHAVEAHFTFRISESNSTVCEDNRPHYSSGPYNPFVGYTTRTGTIEPNMSFVEKDILLTKLRNIIELASWTNKQGECPYTHQFLQSNIYLLIETLVMQYTDTKLTTFSPFVGQRRSGTVQHHVRCPGYKESIVPNTLLNTYSHAQGESDTNLFVNRQPGAHYRINFLHIYCYAIAGYFAPWEIYKTPLYEREFWCVNTQCPTCLQPIQETPIVINDALLGSIDFSELKITKVHEDAMEVIALSLDAHKDRVYLVPSDDTDLTLVAATEGVLQEIMEVQYRSRNALINRYTQHTMTTEARNILSSFAVKDKRREIGWTEIKRLDANALLNGLMNMIYHMIFKYVRWDGSTKLANHLGLIPPQELPWYDIIVLLTSAGKIPDIAKAMQQRLAMPTSNIFNNPETSTLVLGYHAVVNQDYFLRSIPIIILSNYALPQISAHVARQLTAVAKNKYNMEFNAYMPRPYENLTDRRSKIPINELPYTENQWSVIIASLMFWLIPYSNEDRVKVDHENIGNRTILITELIDVDYDEIIAVALNINTNTYSDIENNHVKQLIRRYKIDPNDISELVDIYNERATAFLKPIIERFEVDVTITTLSDCVGMVREVRVDEEVIDLDIQVRQRPGTTRFVPSPPRTSNCVQRIANVPEEGWINEPTHTIWEEFPYIPEPLRHIEYMSRPYGNTNCSMTTLLYIFKMVGVITNRPVQALTCACLADGVGGMSSLLALMAPGSRILYSTLHTEVGITYKPVTLITIAEEKNCSLHVDTIRTGMTDLTKDHVTDYMKTLIVDVDVLTCDIEIRTWSTKIHDMHRNVLDLYLSCRSRTGFIVFKINHDYAEENLWLIHILSNYCEFIYLLHPPTIRCHKISYVVAWGSKLPYTGQLPCYPLRRESILIRAAYRRFRDARLTVHNQKIRESLDDTPRLTPIVSGPIYMAVDLPILFLSLLTHQVGIYIDRDIIMNLPYETDNDLGYVNDLCKALLRTSCIKSYVDNYEKHLLESASIIFRNKPYNLDTRAHRVYIVQQCMKIKGLLCCLQYYSQSAELVQTHRSIKTDYLDYYDQLQQRDQYINEPDSHFAYTIIDNGIPVSYYANWIKGYNVGLTFVAYCRVSMINQRQSTMGLQQKYLDNESPDYQPHDE